MAGKFSALLSVLALVVGSAASCNDCIMNDGETGIDCGGSCATACVVCPEGATKDSSCSLEFGSSSYITSSETVSELTKDWSASVWAQRKNFFEAGPLFSLGGDRYFDSLASVPMAITVDFQADQKVVINYNGKIVLSTSQAFPSVNKWIHVALTYASANRMFTLYIDGTQVSSAALSQAIPSFIGEPRLSLARHYHDPLYFTGFLDEFRLYSSLLTAAQITSEFLGEFKAQADSMLHLQVYYSFDEQQSVTGNIADSSTSTKKNDGKLVGRASVLTPLGQCIGTCSDGMMNGDETGVDCGGKRCTGTKTTCSTCFDCLQNGNELGVDCGGSCSPCDRGRPVALVRGISSPDDEGMQTLEDGSRDSCSGTTFALGHASIASLSTGAYPNTAVGFTFRGIGVERDASLQRATVSVTCDSGTTVSDTLEIRMELAADAEPVCPRDLMELNLRDSEMTSASATAPVCDQTVMALKLAVVRMSNITVEAGAVVSNAVLHMTAAATSPAASAEATHLLISIADADNTPSLCSTTGTSTAAAAATVAWTVPSFTQNTIFDTPDLAALLNQVIGRKGWVKGNSITLSFTLDPAFPSSQDQGHSIFTARALDVQGQVHRAPELAVTYFKPSTPLFKRMLTTAVVKWTVGEWLVGERYSSPDLSPVLQEVLQQQAWKVGNAITVVIMGTSSTTNNYALPHIAVSFAGALADGDKMQAPSLSLSFTPSSTSTSSSNNRPVASVAKLPDQVIVLGQLFSFSSIESLFSDADRDPLSFCIGGLPINSGLLGSATLWTDGSDIKGVMTNADAAAAGNGLTVSVSAIDSHGAMLTLPLKLTTKAAPTCSDGTKNGDEIAADCGGSCGPCTSCSDCLMNGGEMGVDCGGPRCPACPAIVGGQGPTLLESFPQVPLSERGEVFTFGLSGYFRDADSEIMNICVGGLPFGTGLQVYQEGNYARLWGVITKQDIEAAKGVGYDLSVTARDGQGHVLTSTIRLLAPTGTAGGTDLQTGAAGAVIGPIENYKLSPDAILLVMYFDANVPWWQEERFANELYSDLSSALRLPRQRFLIWTMNFRTKVVELLILPNKVNDAFGATVTPAQAVDDLTAQFNKPSSVLRHGAVTRDLTALPIKDTLTLCPASSESPNLYATCCTCPPVRYNPVDVIGSAPGPSLPDERYLFSPNYNASTDDDDNKDRTIVIIVIIGSIMIAIVLIYVIHRQCCVNEDLEKARKGGHAQLDAGRGEGSDVSLRGSANMERGSAAVPSAADSA